MTAPYGFSSSTPETTTRPAPSKLSRLRRDGRASRTAWCERRRRCRGGGGVVVLFPLLPPTTPTPRTGASLSRLCHRRHLRLPFSCLLGLRRRRLHRHRMPPRRRHLGVPPLPLCLPGPLLPWSPV
ncbi:unnamed protein product, partial [Pylaiella littoralis]